MSRQKSRADLVSEAMKGATLEEIGEIAESLAAIVVAEMPDPDRAGQLFGEAVARSARAIRQKSAS